MEEIIEAQAAVVAAEKELDIAEEAQEETWQRPLWQRKKLL